jgi:hypothetical protein
MPFDGTSPAHSPLAVLLEADCRLTTAKRAAAKLRPKHPMRAPSPEKLSQRLATAREAVTVFDTMEQLFDGGRHWGQRHYYDGNGSYCLVGALRHISVIREVSIDAAIMYLKRAIDKTETAERAVIIIVAERIECFNDERKSYAGIQTVICLARNMAQRSADRCGRQLEQALSAQS